ncbi:hypothetical protein F66182_7386 [Fusarium sp. NRRL 66182]|nr:hypothetical protein F66182_7386 [Fusarium sp. NRRL 66182]
MESPVLLCALLMFTVLYWHGFFLVDYLLRKHAPTWYGRLQREDELRKLIPLILGIVRMAIGLVVSLPACVQAARTTPWGVNQPLNTAGQICVVSQVGVWLNEVPQVRFYSFELFVHHILCLLATANIIVMPSMNQIKPLYIYFASLLGDIGPVSVMILRMAGHHISTSRLMYSVASGSTAILIFCRIGCAFYTLTQVLTDPYSLTDWVWVMSIFLYGSYSIYVAFGKLRWLGIIRVDPALYRVTYLCRFAVPISHSLLATGCSLTLLSTLFFYGLYIDRPLYSWEVGLLSLNGLVAVAVGLTGALVVRLVYPQHASRLNPWGTLYLPYGMALTAIWVVLLVANFMEHDAQETILASMGVNVPLFYAVARMAQLYSVKDAAAACNEKPPPDENLIKENLRAARQHAAIFVVSLALVASNVLSLAEAARLAVAACLVVLFKPAWSITAVIAPDVEGFGRICIALMLLVVNPAVVAAVIARFIRADASFVDTVVDSALLGGAILVSIAVSTEKPVLGAKMATKPCKANKFIRYYPLIFVLSSILQGLVIWKFVTFEGHVPEISVGFKNFRSILSNPFTWVGVLQMGSLPVVVMRAMG